MVNINILASEVANIVGKSDDIVTVRRIRDAFVSYFTRFIRDTVSSNKVIPESITCIIKKQVERLTAMSDYYINDNIIVKITSTKISEPLRFFDNTPFIRVSSPSSQITFSYTASLADVLFDYGGQCTTSNRYIYENGKIILFSSNPLLIGFNKISIKFVPENPLSVIDDDGIVSFTYDNYPAPADLASIAKTEILKNLFPGITSIEEVKVDDQEK